LEAAVHFLGEERSRNTHFVLGSDLYIISSWKRARNSTLIMFI